MHTTDSVILCACGAVLYRAVHAKGLTNKIFEAFACRVVGNEAEVLMIDYTIDCLSSEYWMLVVVAILLMVLWSFGVRAQRHLTPHNLLSLSLFV